MNKKKILLISIGIIILLIIFILLFLFVIGFNLKNNNIIKKLNNNYSNYSLYVANPSNSETQVETSKDTNENIIVGTNDNWISVNNSATSEILSILNDTKVHLAPHYILGSDYYNLDVETFYLLFVNNETKEEIKLSIQPSAINVSGTNYELNKKSLENYSKILEILKNNSDESKWLNV